MTSTSDAKSVTHMIYSFGASVRGPLHQKEGQPNEDAWLHAHGDFGSLVVVCDGMGSRPSARVGSQMACMAVKEAVSRWSKVQRAPISYLTYLIEILWRLRLHPVDPASAATTCLFALASPSGTWLVGGVGDGLALVRSNLEMQIIIGDRGNGFCNEASGLGASKGQKAWSIAELAPTNQERIAVLATDGISDDLRPERLNDFCNWLIDSFERLSPRQRWHGLASELRAWPTPGHLDDKTLAVLHMPRTIIEEKI